MASKELLEAVDKYIEKYYVPVRDDITMDHEMRSIFDKISIFRKNKNKSEGENVEIPDFEIDEAADLEFDVSSMQKIKITSPMAATIQTNRRIDDLVNQVDETFSQRLLRMIDERGMTDAEAYNKAFVDRKHFNKIKNDVDYSPKKKTVLAFSIALELSMDETKDLLASAGFALSRSSKTDIIVAYFLNEKNYNMFEINEILDDYDQPTF